MERKKSSLREKLQKRQEETSTSRTRGNNKGILDFSVLEEGRDVNFYSPEVGKNVIDIVPFYITALDKHPDKEKMEEGDPDYVLLVSVHRYVGPTEKAIICLKDTYGKRCPICEEKKNLIEQGEYDSEKIH